LGEGESVGVWKCYSATTRIEPSDSARSGCYNGATAALQGATLRGRKSEIRSPKSETNLGSEKGPKGKQYVRKNLLEGCG